jgi:hypothetical protein
MVILGLCSTSVRVIVRQSPQYAEIDSPSSILLLLIALSRATAHNELNASNGSTRHLVSAESHTMHLQNAFRHVEIDRAYHYEVSRMYLRCTDVSIYVMSGVLVATHQHDVH